MLLGVPVCIIYLEMIQAIFGFLRPQKQDYPSLIFKYYNGKIVLAFDLCFLAVVVFLTCPLNGPFPSAPVPAHWDIQY